jgi:hypothetical protein
MRYQHQHTVGLPFGLFMTLVGGGELFTGNTALVTAALYEKRASVKGLLKVSAKLFITLLYALAACNTNQKPCSSSKACHTLAVTLQFSMMLLLSAV